MIVKSLLFLSLFYSFIGFNLFSQKVDDRLASFNSREDISTAVASNLNGNFLEIKKNSSVKTDPSKLYINSKYYGLFDQESGEFLVGKESEAKTPIASTTKIMTAVIALENYNLYDIVSVPIEATSQTPTVVNLRQNEKISINELLHCLLIKSGNDAAYTIATNMDKSENPNFKQFVLKMNEKAKELNMTNTYFYDPAGLDDNGYSSARDLSIITRYALKNPIFKQIVQTEEYMATNTTKTVSHYLENSNRLVTTYNYPGAIGVKTGFTYAASHCLVAAAERNDHGLIAIILSTYADTPTASADEARKLLDWGFANVTWPD